MRQIVSAIVKTLTAILFGIIVIALLYWGWTFLSFWDAPKNVQEDFWEATETLFTSLDLCRKGKETIYVIEASTGFVHETTYYRADGKKLGSQKFSDVVVGGMNVSLPPVDIGEYRCWTLKTSPHPLLVFVFVFVEAIEDLVEDLVNSD